ncbi:MAG: hypothetical protein QM781_18735 [Chitinophagaceae bacterium]
MSYQEHQPKGLTWGEYSIKFDYDYNPTIRNSFSTKAGETIFRKIEARRTFINGFLENVSSYKNKLQAIPFEQADDLTPFWNQNWLPSFDAILLYGLISVFKPENYIEIGSGNSTKFARRAIADNNLSTRIISIDPYPRADVESICDISIREKVESIPHEKILSIVKPGDILFINNSHRSFQGSDVTVCLTEIIPSLPAGVIYGLHDIFIPFDYPQWFNDYYYNEQYLFQCYLLGGAANDEILLPTWYISNMRELASPLYDILYHPDLQGVNKGGSSFWMKKN